MPTNISTLSCSVWEDSGLTYMARVVGNNNVNIVQADIASITCKVFDGATPTGTTTPAVVVATSVFDTLQTDARWTVDLIGYNFRFTIPASSFAPPGDYIVEFLCDPANGENFVMDVLDVQVKSILGS